MWNSLYVNNTSGTSRTLLPHLHHSIPAARHNHSVRQLNEVHIQYSVGVIRRGNRRTSVFTLFLRESLRLCGCGGSGTSCASSSCDHGGIGGESGGGWVRRRRHVCRSGGVRVGSGSELIKENVWEFLIYVDTINQVVGARVARLGVFRTQPRDCTRIACVLQVPIPNTFIWTSSNEVASVWRTSQSANEIWGIRTSCRRDL